MNGKEKLKEAIGGYWFGRKTSSEARKERDKAIKQLDVEIEKADQFYREKNAELIRVLRAAGDKMVVFNGQCYQIKWDEDSEEPESVNIGVWNGIFIEKE